MRDRSTRKHRVMCCQRRRIVECNTTGLSVTTTILPYIVLPKAIRLDHVRGAYCSAGVFQLLICAYILFRNLLLKLIVISVK